MADSQLNIPQTTLFIGAGTAEYPYIIATAEELAALAKAINAETHPYSEPGTHYRLDNDIDLTGYLSVSGAGHNNGAGWIPIGTDGIGQAGYDKKSFKGVFDGNYHTIHGLYIKNTVLEYYTGLFGMVMGGVIKNLGVINADITGIYDVGCIAGYIDGESKIENCFATGSVTGDLFVGGIVACVGPACLVSTCYCTASVGGNNYVGGISGCVSDGVMHFHVIHDGGKITNCAALNDSVRSEGAGRNYFTKEEFHPYSGRITGFVQDCYLSNNVAFSHMSRDGGVDFIGKNNDQNLGGANISAPQIASDGTIGGRFTAENGWVIQDGSLPGFGTVTDLPAHLTNNIMFQGNGTYGDPYLINSEEDLAELSILVNSQVSPFADRGVCYKLTNDIDLAAYLSADGKGYNRGRGWIPIGTDSVLKDAKHQALRAFKGVFDGNNKIIKGLYINNNDKNTGYYSSGLFGTLLGGVIKNLGLKETNINGLHYVGGIAGYIDNASKIANSYVEGRVAGTSYIGGIAALVGPGSIIDGCCSAAVILGLAFMGGIASLICNGAFYMAPKYHFSRVINCVALNPSLVLDTANLTPAYHDNKAPCARITRVAVTEDVYEFKNILVNNAAYSEMKAPLGVKFTGENTADGGLGGESITAEQIAADKTIGGRLSPELAESLSLDHLR